MDVGNRAADPMSALAGLIVPYPTRSEAGKRAAGSFYTAKLFSERTKALVRLLGWLSRSENSRTL